MQRNREEADLFFCSVTPLQNVRNENLGMTLKTSSPNSMNCILSTAGACSSSTLRWEYECCPDSGVALPANACDSQDLGPCPTLRTPSQSLNRLRPPLS